MKKTRIIPIAFVAMAISFAFIGKENPVGYFSSKKYAFIKKTNISINGVPTDVIFIEDITEFTKGEDYDCEFESRVCTFLSDDANLQAGIAQTDYRDFFYANQVDPTLATPLNSTQVDEGRY